MSPRRLLNATAAVAAFSAALAGTCAVAEAEAVAPWWGLGSVVRPASLRLGGIGQIIVNAENRGDTGTDGSPVIVSDTLPQGLAVVSAKGFAGVGGGPLPVEVPCRVVSGSRLVSCEYVGEATPGLRALPGFESIEVTITVKVQGVVSEENQVSVSGGGAARTVTAARPVPVGGEEAFGFENYELLPENAGGTIDTQAGSHPFQVTTVVALNQSAEAQPAVRMPRQIEVDWPAGLIGDPSALPQCTDAQFGKQAASGALNECPPETAVGVAQVAINDPITLKRSTLSVPVFNLTPVRGEPARFGFKPAASAYLDTSVRTGGDYGVSAVSRNIPQLVGFLDARVTIWGVPGDPRHDGQRGWECTEGRSSSCGVGGAASSAFLAMPTSCEEPFTSTVSGESWAVPGGQPLRAQPLSYTLPFQLDGCDELLGAFAPEVSIAPEVSQASTPSGLEVRVHVPQNTAFTPEGLAQAAVRDTTVTLPAGLALDPSGTNGLEACSEQQIGFLGKDHSEPALNLFTPTLPTPSCPDASKVGSLEIETPLLPHALKGAVYFATPAPNGEAGKNPFDSLLALYLVAEDPVSGVLVKVAGKVTPDPVSGQLTTTFEDTPQVPFENLRIHLFGGAEAALATPGLCGTYTSSASMVPWALQTGEQPAKASSSFQITSGPGGSACADPLPFAPELQAGSSNIQAGAFAPLLTTIGHRDGDQPLGGLGETLPPGLIASLSKVKLCGEPQAAEGTCSAASLIGHATVTAGLGSDPAVIKTPGEVYITGPYRGAPFGLSIVTPAEAGPVDLGNVIVRASIQIDPLTAQVSIQTDPLPTIKDGVPFDLKHVSVTVDRPRFTLNPTSCEKMSVHATIASSEGASASLSTPFQVANCASLPFKPAFTAATKAKHTRRNGAYLHTTLTSSEGQANIRSLLVKLPQILPSREATLKLACPQAQFEANPAGCPAESQVGTAIVRTPLLPEALAGPAILVGHGGAGFPDLDLVLQGYGITIEQVGTVNIVKDITSVEFKSIPDAPIESVEVTAPQGPHSVLAATANLCTTTHTNRHGHTVGHRRKITTRRTLTLPTTITAQNGIVIQQATKITVTGCPKTKHRR